MPPEVVTADFLIPCPNYNIYSLKKMPHHTAWGLAAYAQVGRVCRVRSGRVAVYNAIASNST